MKLCFDTVDELRAFVKEDLKTKKSGKAGDGDEAATGSAPSPAMPAVGGQIGAVAGFPSGGFAPQGAGAGPTGAAFPAAGAPVMAPEVAALVQRITIRMDGAVQSGATKAEDMLTWFRGQCAGVDPSAANATLDQIKQVFLPKLSVPALDQIAKMMAA
jgi:hypothetical protein